MKTNPPLPSLRGCFALALACCGLRAAAADSDLPEVKPVDLAKFSPADFADEDRRE